MLRLCRSRSRSAALAAAAFATLTAARAAAQPCCAGGASITPARLAIREDALVGLMVKGAYVHGSFDAARRFVASPSGSVELDLEQDLIAAVRVLGRLQLSMLLPMVETWRRFPGVSEFGGDLGDLKLGARWDFTLAGASRKIPGLALSALVTAPTGRAPEHATKPLATDATGTGAAEVMLAVAAEQTFGSWLVTLGGSATWRAPRTAGSLEEQLGLQFAASATGAYMFESELVLGLTASYTAETAPSIGGARVAQGGRAATRVGLAAGYPITPMWRLQSSLFADLPVRWLGRGQPASAGATFLVIRSFS